MPALLLASLPLPPAVGFRNYKLFYLFILYSFFLSLLVAGGWYPVLLGMQQLLSPQPGSAEAAAVTPAAAGAGGGGGGPGTGGRRLLVQQGQGEGTVAAHFPFSVELQGGAVLLQAEIAEQAAAYQQSSWTASLQSLGQSMLCDTGLSMALSAGQALQMPVEGSAQLQQLKQWCLQQTAAGTLSIPSLTPRLLGSISSSSSGDGSPLGNGSSPSPSPASDSSIANMPFTMDYAPGSAVVVGMIMDGALCAALALFAVMHTWLIVQGRTTLEAHEKG